MHKELIPLFNTAMVQFRDAEEWMHENICSVIKCEVCPYLKDKGCFMSHATPLVKELCEDTLKLHEKTNDN